MKRGPALPQKPDFLKRLTGRPTVPWTSFPDAVDVSSTGTRVPSNWTLVLRAQDLQEPETPLEAAAAPHRHLITAGRSFRFTAMARAIALSSQAGRSGRSLVSGIGTRNFGCVKGSISPEGKRPVNRR
jgi:hypothetical protein